MAALSVFKTPELMLLIVQKLDIISLVTFGHCSHKARRYIQSVFASLVWKAIAGFFGYKENVVQHVFSTLGEVKGVITGSCLIQLLRPHDRTGIPNNLNIVVPSGGYIQMLETLLVHGYRIGLESMSARFKDTVKGFAELRHAESGRIILLSESTTASVLKIILDGHSTASMTVLTGTTFISFYPHLTLSNRAISGFTTPSRLQIQHTADWGIALSDPTLSICHFSRCGEYDCPGILQRVRGLRGIGLLHWKSNDRMLDDVSESEIGWRLGPFCRNYLCQTGMLTSDLLWAEDVEL